MFIGSVLFDIRSQRTEQIDQALVAEALRKVLHDSASARDKTEAIPGAESWQTSDIMSRCASAHVRASEARNAITLLEHVVCRFNELSLHFDVYILETAGYNPAIQMLVIVEGNRLVRAVKVLSHQESLDYGARLLAPDSDWPNSLLEQTRPALMLPLQGTALDAVSGATITAEAIRRAVADSLQVKPYTAEQHE